MSSVERSSGMILNSTSPYSSTLPSFASWDHAWNIFLLQTPSAHALLPLPIRIATVVELTEGADGFQLLSVYGYADASIYFRCGVTTPYRRRWRRPHNHKL